MTQSPRWGPAAVASSEAGGPSGSSILGRDGGAVQPLQASPRFGLSTGSAPPAPEDGSPGLCRPRRWAVAGGAGQHRGLGAGSALVTAGQAVAWPVVRSRWPWGTVPGSYPPPPHPQPAPAPGLSYLHLLCPAAVSTPRVTGGWVGGPGAPGAPSLGLMLLAERGPVSGEAGGSCGPRGLPFQPQSTCNWIHQHRQRGWSRGAPAPPAAPPRRAARPGLLPRHLDLRPLILDRHSQRESFLASAWVLPALQHSGQTSPPPGALPGPPPAQSPEGPAAPWLGRCV